MIRIPDHAAAVKSTLRRELPPDGRRLAEGLIRQGYDFEQAVADVVDNAVDEAASKILVRFLIRPGGGFDLLIADNGAGMTEQELEDGMRVGSRMRKDSSRLGKFGLGLKQASLSQCDRLIVATRARRTQSASACGWDNEGLRSSMAEFWHAHAAERFLELDFAGLDLRRSGTVVYWQGANSKSDPETVQKLRRDLKVYLGIHFHRFISRGMQFLVDMPTLGEQPIGLPPERIEPIDPFGYSISGDSDYPRTFTVRYPEYPAMKIRAHVFPHKNDQSPEDKVAYRLYRGANNASGFYVYRNDRLIVAGEWFKKLKHEAHNSLARIEMSLPPELDDLVRLNVQKVGVQFPAEFLDAIWSARDGDVTFANYLRAADRAYRSRTGRQHLRDYPFVPSSGFPSHLSRLYQRLIGAPRGKSRSLDFRWSELPPTTFFDLDRVEKVIHLNERYRSHFRNGARKSAVDAPLVKLMLMFLVEADIDRSHVRSEQVRKHEQWNKMLLECLRVEGRK